jgi:hypothetical protein
MRLSRRLRITLGTLSVALAACSSAPVKREPSEFLDEHTGATITIVETPIVFARARPNLAANLRDYITLSAASVNRSGKITYALVAYFWSTIDVRSRPETLAVSDNVVIAADDRRIRLSAHGHSPKEIGITQPVHAPPEFDGPPTVYGVDLDTLRFVSHARSLRVIQGEDGTAVYEIWDDGRESLAKFVNFLNGE